MSQSMCGIPASLALMVVMTMALPASELDPVDAVMDEFEGRIIEVDEALRDEIRDARNAAATQRQKAAVSARKDLERLLRRVKNDPPLLAKTYKALLRIDREHAEARTYFESLGVLDQVLADLRTSGDFMAQEADVSLNKGIVRVAGARLQGIGTIQVAEKWFSDRDYAVLSVSENVQGWKFSRFPARHVGDVRLQADGVARVVLLCLDLSKADGVVDKGRWKPVPEIRVGLSSGGVLQAFVTELGAGEQVTLQSGGIGKELWVIHPRLERSP